MPKDKALQKHVEEVTTVISEILSHPTKYFDKNLVLNSEGMKLFSRLAKMVIDICPELRSYVAEARRRPSYESIAKICAMIRESRCLEGL